MEIALHLLHVVLLLAVLADFIVIAPISEIIEFIPDALNGQRLHACPGAAIGLEDPKGIGGLCGHLLSAEAFCLDIGDIVRGGVQRCVAGQQPRICYI